MSARGIVSRSHIAATARTKIDTSTAEWFARSISSGSGSAASFRTWQTPSAISSSLATSAVPFENRAHPVQVALAAGRVGINVIQGGPNMPHYLDLFTPRTWTIFMEHGQDVSGFRYRQRASAAKIKPGDVFLCYLVKVSRWAGALEVTSECYIDETPIFDEPDPYTVRFQVRPIITFPAEHAIPIDAQGLWESLSLTRNMERRAAGWAQHANLRASLRAIAPEDAELIMTALRTQAVDNINYPFSPAEQRRMARKKTIQTETRAVIIEIPEDDEEEIADVQATLPDEAVADEEARESHQIQATLAHIGAEMGFRVWIPRGDRQKVLGLVSQQTGAAFLDVLPLNYDDATLRTVEQIDVIWLKNRSMARAFEVEHTTAIYSGLLRMADLLALQPNMNIRLHIVAPAEKREKVLREIRRPVFSLLDRGPLYESCSYLPYDAIRDIASTRHLGHMSDSLIEEYEESAQDD
jgi:hypothetical protein